MRKAFCFSVVLLGLATMAWASGDAYGVRIIDGEVRACTVMPSGEAVLLENVWASQVGGSAEWADYFWFAVGPETTGNEAAEPAIILEKVGEVGVFLPMPEAETCNAVWGAPDGKKLLLSFDVDEFFSDLVLYDLIEQEMGKRFRGVGWATWMDAYRFAYTTYDRSRTHGREDYPDGDPWSSVAVYEIFEDEEVEPYVVRQGTETENYSLDDVDEQNAELIIRKESVRTLKDWQDRDRIMYEDIREPFPAAG